MSTPDLTFNILAFSHPSDEYTFCFYSVEHENLQRVHKSLVPDEVISEFGERDHYYTSFEEKGEGALAVTKFSKPVYTTAKDENGDEFHIKIENSSFSKSILKRFYIDKIRIHFKGKGVIVTANFVDDIEIWLPAKISNTAYNFFNKYILKVQFAVVSFKPEILVTYEGQSKVFRKSIADLMSQVAPDCFNWVLHKNNLFKYEDLTDDARRNYNEVFPVLNFDIRDALHLPVEAPNRNNHYIRYKNHITFFFDTCLNNDAFKKVIPIDGNGFIPVKELNIGAVSVNTNLLIFGNNKQHIAPYKGMDEYGPLEIPKANRTQFFYICHSGQTDKATLLNDFFIKGMHSFKGMYKFAKIPFHTEPHFSIVFRDLNNPIPEIEQTIRKRIFKTDVQYIAIYITPHSKYGSTKQHKSIYYKVKELLLKRGITSQTIEVQKINNDPIFAFCLNNIAIAILAKLNGIPWRLDVKLKNELIVGIGAFKNIETDIQYIGSAFSFSNNGKFNSFDCFMKNQVDELAGSIIQSVKEYVAAKNSLERLIIHFYKQMSNHELNTIEESLHNLGLNIPVFIVSINKTESHDIIAFDNAWPGLMPESGTFINFGPGRYLLFNNTRYSNTVFKINDGYPFPVKLSIKCTMPELEKDPKIIRELLT